MLMTSLKKMVPNFFEINTPKLTKLANKINFGTKIERENITNCTISGKSQFLLLAQKGQYNHAVLVEQYFFPRSACLQT